MTLYDQTKYFFLIPSWCFPVATCCSTKKHFSYLIMQQHTWQYNFTLGVAVNSSKSFLVALIFVALDNFTVGIATSVRNFAKCQLTPLC